MKVDFNYRFKELSGKPIKTKDEGEIDTVLTLRKACVNSLLTTQLDSRGAPKRVEGMEKFKRYQLAMEIYNSNGLLDLRAEQIKLLKTLVSDVYAPLVSGQAWEILDPVAAEEPEKEEPKK